MRQLILWNVITLDGYFEGITPWDLSFHEVVWGPELEQFSLEQLHTADYLVFGRATYEGMAAYWKDEKGDIADLMNSLPKLVFSKTLTSADWNNTTLISDDASKAIKKLKEEDGKAMFVFGSAHLSETFMNDSLFDEYRIGIAPVILGSGRPFFKQGMVPKGLTLVSTQQLLTGGVVLRYSV